MGIERDECRAPRGPAPARVIIFVGLVAMSACVDVMRPLSRRTSPAVERARAEAEAAARARRAARVAIPDDQRDTPRVVDTEGAITRAVYGPLRFEVERGVVRAADDITATPIDSVRRASRGWVFLARDSVYVSETFTGRLRPLASFHCRAREGLAVVPEVSRERAVLTLFDGGVFWSDGATLHEFEDRDAVSLAWSDASRGAVILDHRVLRVTRDGGAHWRAIDLRAEVPLRVEGDDTGLRVLTDAGLHHLDDHDELTAAEPAPRVLPVFHQCDLPANEDAIRRDLDARAYDVVPEAPRSPRCERDAQRAMWRAPSFALDVASVTPTNSDPAWNVPSPTRSALGSRDALTSLDSGSIAAVASLSMDHHREGVPPVSLAWRSEDDLGPFASRVRARTPDGVLFGAQWVLVAATRRGVLFELTTQAPGATGEGDSPPYIEELFWFSSNAASRTHVGFAGAGEILGSVALSDGGAIVLGRFNVARSRRCDGPLGEINTRVAYALHLAPDGRERARRVAVDDPASRTVVGLGELDGRWGIAVAERAEPERLALLTLDGGEIPFGRWRFDSLPAPCGERVAGAARLHLLESVAETNNTLSGVHVGPRPEGYDFADARDLSFERVGERVCVRRVWASQRAGSYEFEFEDVRDVRAAVRFEARGDHFEGTFDDGERIARLRAAIIAPPPVAPRTADE